MKKLLTIAVAALMTLTLVGCGGSSSSASKLVVGTNEMNGDFVEGITNNSYDKDIRDLIHGYNPVVVDADGVLQWQTVVLDGEPTAVENADGTFKLDADTVIYATGQKSLSEEAWALNDCADELHVIGDCVNPENIMAATQAAYNIALDIGRM